MRMRPASRIYLLDDQNEKFFGEGPSRLLRAVEETGSLRAAAISMEMAYSKANRLIKTAEAALGFRLLTRVTGGRDGGGSRLTEEGAAWLARFETYRDACLAANRRLFAEYFPARQEAPRFGCVIMASGLGRRFGSNKLLAALGGRPLLAWVLDATEGLFDHRVVVTRHEAVRALCASRGIPVVLHDLPYRSDTVRLGLAALPDGLAGCLFCAGDQPLVTRESLLALRQAAAREPDAIWRLAYGKAAGAPVLFPQRDFAALQHLPAGKGGGVLLRQAPERVKTVQAENNYELDDIDCPEDLERLCGLLKERGEEA